MNCQNCHEIIEPGANFCGNCGYPIKNPATSPPQTQSGVPTYAVGTPAQHVGETQGILSVIFGTIGVVGGAVVPFIGIIFGASALALSTISRRKARRRVALIGFAMACLAIVAGFGSLAWNLEKNNKAGKTMQIGRSSTSAKTESQLSTKCYSFNLVDTYNVSNSTGSCDVTAYNGKSFGASTDIYKVVADSLGTSDPSVFTALAKQTIEKDIQDNFNGFTITKEGATSFAGSLAYSVAFDNPSIDNAAIETAVLHQTPGGDNAFIILHGVNGTSANLQTIEAQWQWK